MIDVIVATYNRPKQLARCLDALGRQRGVDFRAIVVDDCSPQPVDATLDRSRYGFPITVIRTEGNSGPAHARNLGVANSNADLIVFIDDDVVADENLLSRHQESHERLGDHQVVIGPLAAPPDWKSTPWTRWEAETIAAEYRRMVAGVYAPTWRQFFTGNASLRSADFVRAGGFNESFLRAEDIEFAYRMHRLGCSFVFDPQAIGWHYSDRSLESWRKIPRLYAWSDRALDGLYPELRWQDLMERERQGRHAATRLVERTLRHIGARRAGAKGAITAARGAAGIGANRIASRLLSMAYELEYRDAADALEGGRAFNTASTATG